MELNEKLIFGTVLRSTDESDEYGICRKCARFKTNACTKLKLPLDSPDNKQFTFGLTSKKLSKRVDAITSAINNVKNALFGLIGHVNEDDSSS